MPKKSSPKNTQIIWKKDINLPGDLIKTIFVDSPHHFYRIGSPPGPTKSLIKATSSGPCIHNKQLPHPQLTHVTVHYTPGWRRCERHTWAFSDGRSWYWRLAREGNNDVPNLNVTYPISRVTFPNWRERRWIKYKSTTIDPYDSKNQVMKITNVVGCGGKFYALSMQGCLVVMEENGDAQLGITGICVTRAVPTVTGKYFKEYLIESRGEVLLVFLIYKESIERVDEIEVFRLDVDRLDLVKVDTLQGRTFLLELKYSVWVDSGEIGCKGDCVYFFTGEMGGNGDKWWMYDMKNRSISLQEPRITDLL